MAKQKQETKVLDVCAKCGQVHTKCLAHKRRKDTSLPLEPCGQWPAKGDRNRKCGIHGAKTPKGEASPHFKTGQHSKYSYLPANVRERVELMAGDAIENLERMLNTQAALETRAHERLGTGESSEAWLRLRQAVREYDGADFMAEEPQALVRAKAMGMIRFIVDGGLSDAYAVRDIQSIHETQRKTTETLTKCRKDIQETYTLTQWEMFMSIVMRVIKNNVDRTTLAKLQRDFGLEADGPIEISAQAAV
jgi:hypothetical protein